MTLKTVVTVHRFIADESSTTIGGTFPSLETALSFAVDDEASFRGPLAPERPLPLYFAHVYTVETVPQRLFVHQLSEVGQWRQVARQVPASGW